MPYRTIQTPNPATNNSSTVPLRVLEQKHPDLDLESYYRRELLYRGGEEIEQPENARKFIPKNFAWELDAAYQQRLGCASYTNLYASIINLYVSQLMSKPLTMVPKGQVSAPIFYDELNRDADCAGTSFKDILRDLMTEGMKHGEAFIGADLPASNSAPINRLQEEQSQSDRAYLVPIPRYSIIDWAYDPHGKFEWCKLKKEYRKEVGPFAERDTWITEYRIWTVENGQAHWRLYEYESKGKDKPDYTAQNAPVALKAEGSTSFSRIPIERLTLPFGLWLGGKISSKCAEHFRLKTGLLYAQMRSLYAAPYFKEGSPIEGNLPIDDLDPKNVDTIAQRWLNKGFMHLTSNDDVGFLEPSGSSYQIAYEQICDLQDDIRNLADQMAHTISVASTGAQRSAAAKQQDNHGMEIVLAAYGNIAREAAIKLYELVADGRREPEIEWEAKGLSDYKIVDRSRLLEEALTLSQIVSVIPSKEFQKLYTQEVALAVLRNVPHVSEQQIIDEIAEAVEKGNHNTLTDLYSRQHPSLEVFANLGSDATDTPRAD